MKSKDEVVQLLMQEIPPEAEHWYIGVHELYSGQWCGNLRWINWTNAGKTIGDINVTRVWCTVDGNVFDDSTAMPLEAFVDGAFGSHVVREHGIEELNKAI